MIPGYIREVTPEESERFHVNPPYRLVVVDELALDSDWKMAQQGLRCRYMMPNRRSCKKPAVVMLDRSHDSRVHDWWGYCDDPEHLYGHKWIDGRLEGFRVTRAEQDS